MNKIKPGNGFKNQLQGMYDFVQKIVGGFRFDEHTGRDVTQEIMLKLYCQAALLQKNRN